MNQSLEPKPELKTEVKLYDSELKIMEYLWQYADMLQQVSAKDIAAEMARTVGWSKTTTYTVLKKCVEKGAVERHEPGFVCTPLVSMEQVQEYETRELINKMYQGSADLLVASLIGQQKLSEPVMGIACRHIGHLTFRVYTAILHQKDRKHHRKSKKRFNLILCKPCYNKRIYLYILFFQYIIYIIYILYFFLHNLLMLF